MVDSREPPNGDFVAYVEQLEREQLARAMAPHKLPHLSTNGAGASEGAGQNSRALAAADAQRLLQELKAKGAGAAPIGTLAGVAIGGAFIAFGLLAEGGIFFVILGAALLWHNLRALARRRRAALATPARQLDAVFAPQPQPGTRKRNG